MYTYSILHVNSGHTIQVDPKLIPVEDFSIKKLTAEQLGNLTDAVQALLYNHGIDDNSPVFELIATARVLKDDGYGYIYSTWDDSEALGKFQLFYAFKDVFTE